MERKVGDVFDFNGIKLKVKRTDKPVCNGCFFEKFDCGCWQINGIEETDLCFRSDKNDVIFIEVKDDQDKESKL